MSSSSNSRDGKGPPRAEGAPDLGAEMGAAVASLRAAGLLGRRDGRVPAGAVAVEQARAREAPAVVAPAVPVVEVPALSPDPPFARLFALELRTLADRVDMGAATGPERRRLREMVEALKVIASSRDAADASDDQRAIDAVALLHPLLVAARRYASGAGWDVGARDKARDALAAVIPTLPMGAHWTERDIDKMHDIVTATLRKRAGYTPRVAADEIAALILGRKGIRPRAIRQGARDRGASPNVTPEPYLARLALLLNS